MGSAVGLGEDTDRGYGDSIFGRNRIIVENNQSIFTWLFMVYYLVIEVLFI